MNIAAVLLRAKFRRKKEGPVRGAGLAVAYGKVPGLKGLTLDIYENEILSIIGPSNSGKTSFLRP